MLTMLGLIKRFEADFGTDVFESISHVGRLSTTTLCGALGLLLLCSLPVGEFKEIPGSWYSIVYDVLVVLVGVLTGLLIATVLLLFQTLQTATKEAKPESDV